jgi:hypothetical protein
MDRPAKTGGAQSGVRVRPELLAFLASFAVYAMMSAPGVEWMDAGELTAVAFTLGGAHPPGHPAHTLLGKLASFVPVGEVAFRVNLLSALGMAAAVAGVVWLARALVAEAPAAGPALVGAALAAASPLATTNATRAEVYAPVAALVVAATACLVRFVRPTGGAAHGAAGWLLLTALACGCAAAFHPPIAAAAALPVVLTAAWVGRRRLARLAPPALALDLLGLVAYLYLPVRANAEHAPLLVWGNPRSAAGLAELISAPAYRDNFALAGWLGRVGDLGWLVGEGAGLAVLLAGLAGLMLACAARAPGAAATLAAAVAVVAGAGTQRAFNPDMPGYVLPALFLIAAGLAPLAAAAVRALPTRARSWRWTPWLAVAPAVALAGLGSVRRADDGGARRTDDPLRHWDRTVGVVPTGPALYFATEDHALFPAQYERLVAGARPDVAIANDELARDIWFLQHLERVLPELHVPYVDDDARDRPAERLVAFNLRAGRHVGGDVPAFGRLRTAYAAPQGRGYRYALHPIDDSVGSVPPPPIYGGGTGRRVAGRVGLVRGRYEAAHGRLARAAQAAGLTARFSAAELAALANPPATRPALEPLVPARTHVFLFAPWQRELLGDDLAWRAGLPRAALPAAPHERRLLAAWHDVLDDASGALDRIAALDRADRLATAAMLLHLNRLAAAEVVLRALLAADARDEAARRLLDAATEKQRRSDTTPTSAADAVPPPSSEPVE